MKSFKRYLLRNEIAAMLETDRISPADAEFLQYLLDRNAQPLVEPSHPERHSEALSTDQIRRLMFHFEQFRNPVWSAPTPIAKPPEPKKIQFF